MIHRGYCTSHLPIDSIAVKPLLEAVNIELLDILN